MDLQSVILRWKFIYLRMYIVFVWLYDWSYRSSIFLCDYIQHFIITQIIFVSWDL